MFSLKGRQTFCRCRPPKGWQNFDAQDDSEVVSSTGLKRDVECAAQCVEGSSMIVGGLQEAFEIIERSIQRSARRQESVMK